MVGGERFTSILALALTTFKSPSIFSYSSLPRGAPFSPFSPFSFPFVSFLPVLFPFSRRYIPVDKDEVFAFGRTVSRLNEMQSVEYLGETWLSGELASTKTQEREWVREFSLKIISEAELEDIWAR